jgi:hypothetical protein
MKKSALTKPLFTFAFLMLVNVVVSQTPQKQTIDGAVSSTVSGTSTQSTAIVSSTPKEKKKWFRRKTKSTPTKTSPNQSPNEAKLDSIKKAKNKEKGLK